MNDDTIADLKQFIATTVRQEVTAAVRQEVSAVVRQEVTTIVQHEIAGVKAQIETLQASVADALDASNDAVHDQLQDHETRINRLEQRAA